MIKNTTSTNPVASPLAHGSTVAALIDLCIAGGEFYTTTTETVAGKAIPDAIIDCSLVIKSATVTVVKNSTTTGVIGNLKVENGGVRFESGAFKPVVDCGVNGEPIPANEASPDRISKIITTGVFQFNAPTVAVEPRQLNVGVARMLVGRAWNEFLHGDGGTDIQLAAGQGFEPATCNAPLAGTNFVFDPVYAPGTTTLLGLKLKWQAGN